VITLIYLAYVSDAVHLKNAAHGAAEYFFMYCAKRKRDSHFATEPAHLWQPQTLPNKINIYRR
jgi:hypothetical protein